jgi:hypothetical protein
LTEERTNAMGHNRGGDKRRARLKRHKREQARLAKTPAAASTRSLPAAKTKT